MRDGIMKPSKLRLTVKKVRSLIAEQLVHLGLRLGYEGPEVSVPANLGAENLISPQKTGDLPLRLQHDKPHLAQKVKKYRRCMCHSSYKRTFILCSTCQLHICIECFHQYHTDTYLGKK